MNWNTVQTVTITGVDDPVVDGNQTTTVTVSVDPKHLHTVRGVGIRFTTEREANEGGRS